MDTPEQQLEKFIHQQLKKLPEHDAPETLIASVFAAIAARENLPWWKQPFTSWPRRTQMLLYFTLAAIFTAAVYIAWRPAESLTLSSLVEKAASFAWIGRALDTLGNSLVLVMRSLPWQLFVAAVLVVMIMYAACVATGFALYRVNTRSRAAAA